MLEAPLAYGVSRQTLLQRVKRRDLPTKPPPVGIARNNLRLRLDTYRPWDV
jgi:hypothetical protein